MEGTLMEKSCRVPSCPETFPNHKFGKIKACDEGWFFEKNGRIWCPKHRPTWVAKWRKNKGE